MNTHRALSRDTVRRVYDRIGRWQDLQGFYEGPALDQLIRHGAFESARSILEVGCGTGAFAARLLRDPCPPCVEYVGVDLSPRMVDIARDRLSFCGDRARVFCTDGEVSFDEADSAMDRIVATYVLDLLPAGEIRALLSEAHRMLEDHGRLCIAGLTDGESGLGRVVAGAWSGLYRLWPVAVGGCRPLRIETYLDEDRWTLTHRTVVEPWGIPSEVLVATPA